MSVPVQMTIVYSLIVLVVGVLVAAYLYVTREWRAYDRCERAYKRALKVRGAKRKAVADPD
jgi:hypothetical protein